MSWDVVMLAAPAGVMDLSQLPQDFSVPLGPLQEVLDQLQWILPDLDLSDPTWGRLHGPGYSIEFSVLPNDPVLAVMLHVRGGDDAIEPIARLCRQTGWSAFDCGDGNLIDFSADPCSGLRAWREYRDHVLDNARKRGEGVVVDPEISGIGFDAVIKPAPNPTT